VALISVVMPVFNAAKTLSLALASLQAQTCGAWECIVVDDGSTDDPQKVIRAVGDARIQYYCLDRNRGRGYARQRGLEIASGKYIAFLDADDWIYPQKLEEQKTMLEREPSVALVSTGMAISNSCDQLLGVRIRSRNSFTVYPPVDTLKMPSFAFAPSMIVSELAKKTGFDTSFPTSEDVDFLMRALDGKRYAVLHNPLYVYREHGSVSPEKVQSSLRYCRRMFGKQRDRYPVKSPIEIAKVLMKQSVYYAASTCGLWDVVIKRRSQTPDAADHRRFDDAWRLISNIAAGYPIPSCPISSTVTDVPGSIAFASR
jgi:glycosyltransferase involved in cell wall biosynthesis